MPRAQWIRHLNRRSERTLQRPQVARRCLHQNSPSCGLTCRSHSRRRTVRSMTKTAVLVSARPVRAALLLLHLSTLYRRSSNRRSSYTTVRIFKLWFGMVLGMFLGSGCLFKGKGSKPRSRYFISSFSLPILYFTSCYPALDMYGGQKAL